jgi:DNA-binding CsgD family transcriptional regulator/tetratricopeptide (TPR) repeat protein
VGETMRADEVALRSLQESLPRPSSRPYQGARVARRPVLPNDSRGAVLMMALDGSGDVRVLEPGAPRLTFRHPMSDQLDRNAWRMGEAAIERDEKVAAMLEQAAATILRRGDGLDAVAALIRAAELSPAACDRARRLAHAAYLGARVTGDLRTAEALLADARHGVPELPASLEAAIATSFVLVNSDGDVAAAHRRLVRAIESADGGQAGLATAEQALRLLVLVCHFGGRAELWEPVDRQLRNLGPDLPASLRLSSTVVADPARSLPAALARLDAEIESLPQLADATEIVRIAGTSMFVDRLPSCRQALRRVARDELAGGAVTPVMYAQTLLALEAYLSGQWEEAQRLARAAEEMCEARGYQLLRWNAHAVRTFLAAARGDAALAQALADEMIRWAAPRGVRHLQTGARYACVLAALAQSDFEAAYHHATKISPAGQLASHQPYALWVMLDLVEAALRTDRASDAAAHVHAMHAAGVVMISPRLAMLSAAASAMIAPDDEAVELFGQALAISEAERWPFDLARVQLLYGERLRRTHAMVQSRVYLAAAVEAFRRLGAGTWAERAATELRATGQSRSQGRRQEHEALTPQELQIAMLAATGLSNKQIASRLFLSHRTVGFHLYKVFPKLGITSRAALRDALLHPDPADPGSPARVVG